MNNLIIHENLVQGTPEWLEVRRGKITASVVSQLLTSTYKIGKSEKVRLLAFELAAERITGRVTDQFESYDMKRGHLEEDLARDMYAQHYDKVFQVGFMERGILGFSPDGLVWENGIIEIKSRRPKFQIKTFYENEVPPEYVCQIQTGLLVSGREWCDYVQYSNGMPLFVKRMHRDEAIIATIQEAAYEFETLIRGIVDCFKDNAANMPVAEYVEEYAMTDIPDIDFAGIE
jgi:putative phage-type endonuclease